MAKARFNFENPLMTGTKEDPAAIKQGRPKRDDIIRNENGGQSKQEGLTAAYTRFSVIAKVKNVNMLKDYAFTKRVTIRDSLDYILEDFFERYQADPTNEPLLDHTQRKASNNDSRR